MKEYVGLTANMYIVESRENKPLTQAEIVIIVSEPHYQPDGAGGFAKVRANEEMRFSTSIKGIQTLIQQLTVLQDECQNFQERLTIEPEDGHAD